MRLTVLTKIPSPYQVQLLDAVARAPGVELRVVYVKRRDADRDWAECRLGHEATFLEEAHGEAARAMQAADLAVFSWYREPRTAAMLRARAAAARPWCFWAEPPGFSGMGLVGVAYRRWKLAALHAEPRASLWGIGRWAMEGWRDELGPGREYFHVPYASDLQPFLDVPRPRAGPERAVLFSGSLTARKGVVELAEAFARVASRHPAARLRVLGSGPLEAALRARPHPAIELLGFRDWDRLAAIYAGADVLCAPSRHDGWGLVVPEAMAAAMPVIASTHTGAAREMVVEGETGWLVPPRDAAALGRALEAALTLEGSALAALGAKARARSREYGLAPGAERFLAAARGSLAAWDRAVSAPARAATR